MWLEQAWGQLHCDCNSNGLHLSGKGAAIFADGLAAAVDSGMCSITNIFGSKHGLN